jgi:hypothetical protein
MSPLIEQTRFVPLISDQAGHRESFDAVGASVSVPASVPEHFGPATRWNAAGLLMAVLRPAQHPPSD